MNGPIADQTASHLVTRLLHAVAGGEAEAREQLWNCIYQELRALARRKIAAEKPGHMLQPTALVHEAYLRLMEGDHGSFESRRHFFGAAAEAMRRILVEDARSCRALKRGGRRKPAEPLTCDSTSKSGVAREYAVRGNIAPPNRKAVDLGCLPEAKGFDGDPTDLLAINEALEMLEQQRAELAEVVKLRFFVGLTGEQTAEVMGVSARTVDTQWRLARAWLYEALSG